MPGERAPVAVLEASWRDSEEKVVRLQRQVLRARALRPEYERAMNRMRLGEFDVAAEALERIVSEMPEHAGAQEELTRARAEILRAAEMARREREATEHAQRLMEELRRRAAPAAAVEDQEGAWSSAEATRAAGLAALDGQSYGTARGHFEAAAELYRTAADALDRRVQQLLGDARRRLEQRQFEACLPLVNEVLALLPDQPEALALNLEAQRGAQEEADRRAAIEQRYDAARRELAAGDIQGAIDALTTLVEQEPDHSRARQLLADARTQLAEEEARVQRLLAEAETRLAEEEARVRLAEEERARLLEEQARARQLLAEAQAQLAEEEARVQRRLAEAEARLAEEEALVRLAEEERARLVDEEARARQALAEARAQLAEEEARVQRRLAEAEARLAEEEALVRLAEEERARLVDEEARARQALAEARAQLAEEEERVQRRLAGSEARLAEEEALIRLAEEERARLVARGGPGAPGPGRRAGAIGRGGRAGPAASDRG